MLPCSSSPDRKEEMQQATENCQRFLSEKKCKTEGAAHPAINIEIQKYFFKCQLIDNLFLTELDKNTMPYLVIQKLFQKKNYPNHSDVFCLPKQRCS